MLGNIINFFSKQEPVTQRKIDSVQLLEEIVTNNVKFKTAAKNIDNSGTLIEIFSGEGKEPILVTNGINGSGATIEFSEKVKTILSSPDTKIVVYRVMYAKNDPLSKIKNKTPIIEYFLNSKLNNLLWGKIENLLKIEHYNTKRLKGLPTRKSTIPTQEQTAVTLTTPIQYTRIQDLIDKFNKIDPNRKFINNIFSPVLKKGNKVDISRENQIPAWETLSLFKMRLDDIMTIYREKTDFRKPKSHKKVIEDISKRVSFKYSQTEIKITPKDVVTCLNYMITTKTTNKSINFDREVDNKKEILDYIKLRQSIYSIKTKERTFSDDEILYGTNRLDISCKLRKHLDKNNIKQLKQEGAGIISNLYPYMTADRFKLYLDQAKVEK